MYKAVAAINRAEGMPRTYKVESYRYLFSGVRSNGFKTKRDAMTWAAWNGYTHAIGNGTYWKNEHIIPVEFRPNWNGQDGHEMSGPEMEPNQ
jgi:hypothetical protein